MFAFIHNILIKLFFGSVASLVSTVVSFLTMINKASAPTSKASRTRAQPTRRVRRSSSISSSSSSSSSSSISSTPTLIIETDSDFAPSSSSSSSSGLSTPTSIASPLSSTVNIAEEVNKLIISNSSALIRYQHPHTRTRQLQRMYKIHQVGLGLSSPSPFVSFPSSFSSRFSA